MIKITLSPSRPALSDHSSDIAERMARIMS